jgi:hypothetical protein
MENKPLMAVTGLLLGLLAAAPLPASEDGADAQTGVAAPEEPKTVDATPSPDQIVLTPIKPDTTIVGSIKVYPSF